MKSFQGGVHPSDMKFLCENMPIEQMPIVPDYYVALSQHIGSPATAVVVAGEQVEEGQLIAKASGKISANIFAPVAGEVVAIEKRKNNLGVLADYIHIKTSEKQSVVVFPKLTDLSKEKITERVEQAGIVGLGGAGFATAVKLSPNKPVDTLIINAAECEPYLNCDNRLMLERADEFMEGVRLLARALNVEKIIIGIENNKLEAYNRLLSYEGIEISLLKKKYPQGAEKTIIYACTKRKVPTGGLPMDVGVVVDNVATAYAVYDAVVNGRPLYKRVMTVSGKGIATPKNIEVLNGTPYKAIIDFCGGLVGEVVKLLSGGPMMGLSLSDDSGVTTKTDSGLLALTSSEANTMLPTPCINCGGCAKVCPMHLMPMYIDFYALAGDYETAVKYGAMNCFECGSCAFTCPAKRPLVQSIKLTKMKMKEKKK